MIGVIRKFGKTVQIANVIGLGRGKVHHWRRGGFTLIELLVVISIIALLLSILMPALNKAKDVAERLICKSQLHQVGLGVIMYTMENGDKLSIGNWFNYPMANNGDSNGNNVPNEPSDDGFVGLDVQPYLSDDLSIFLCPSNKTVRRMPAFSASGAPGMSTYDWYKSGHFNNSGDADHWSSYIYYVYLGNYSYELSRSESPLNPAQLLSYEECMQRIQGIIYPKNTLGPRAKIFQDMVLDENIYSVLGYDESHTHPSGLFTDGSVEGLRKSDLGPHYGQLSVEGVYWYW